MNSSQEESSRKRDSTEYLDVADNEINIDDITKLINSFQKQNEPEERDISTPQSEIIDAEIIQRLKKAEKEEYIDDTHKPIEGTVESLLDLAKDNPLLQRAIISSPEKVMTAFKDFDFRYQLTMDSKNTQLRYLKKFIKPVKDSTKSRKYFTYALYSSAITLLTSVIIGIPLIIHSALNIGIFILLYKGYKAQGKPKMGIWSFVKEKLSPKPVKFETGDQLSEKLKSSVPDGLYIYTYPPVIRKYNGNLYITAQSISRLITYEVKFDKNNNITFDKKDKSFSFT